MDLSKLVNGPPAGQPSYPAYESRAHNDQPQLERQASFGRPHGQLDTRSQPPSLTPVAGQYAQQPFHSPSSYGAPPPPPSPYASRPPSNGQFPPATPVQLQPPNNPLNQPHALSPTPSSQRSHTPQSVHHSPLSALQHGVPSTFGAPPPLNQYRPANHYKSPQQQRTPLGPPSYRAEQPMPQPGLSPAARRVSEREESISPRTLPMPRPGSLGSRQSSMHEENGMYQGGHSTAGQQLESGASQPPPHSRATSIAGTSTYHASPSPGTAASIQIAERPVVRRSATMEMSSLLSSDSTPTPQVKREPEERVRTNGVDNYAESKKRAPEEDLSPAHPVKKERTRRHLERPAWAQLSPRNPRSSGAPIQKEAQRPKHNGVEKTLQPRANGNPAPATASSINFEKPWLNPLPYDMDLIQARQIFGAWEKSIKWNTPYPDLLRALQDWLMQNLQSHQDIAQDPSAGTIEIEAKIGRLIKPSNGSRAELPVLNMTLLSPSVNRDYRFESELQEADFKVLNEFLNKNLVDSMQPGRQRMEYKRVSEKDSFAHLSPAGHALLPKSLHRQTSHGRELKLRTTTHVKTGETTARIIKVPLADLHIYNPTGYDCRISMNAEVNLMRPGLVYEDLITPATEDHPVPPSRTKDRLSYKHLAYQIDLTNVQVPGLAAKYEMEIEVDAQALSSQIQLMAEQKPHAFTEVVSGFLDNATFLMRQR